MEKAVVVKAIETLKAVILNTIYHSKHTAWFLCPDDMERIRTVIAELQNQLVLSPPTGRSKIVDVPENAYGFKVSYIIPPDTSEVDRLLIDLRTEVDRLGKMIAESDKRDKKVKDAD